MKKKVKSRSAKEQRDYSLRNKYGITLQEYDKMFRSQGRVCWICKRPPGRISLSVDHQHTLGEKSKSAEYRRQYVRGIICWRCNSGLQKFKDNADVLTRAGEYIRIKPFRVILDN